MSSLRIDFGPEVEASIATIIEEIERHAAIRHGYPARWLAVALLDDDPGLAVEVRELPGGTALLEVVSNQRFVLRDALGPSADTSIAATRFQWINDTVHEVVTRRHDAPVSATDRIDAVATHRYLGIPLFLLAMWTVFKLTTDVSAAFLDWMGEAMTGPAARLAAAALGTIGLGDTWIEGLVTEGILVGVGAILAFIPVLLTLYLALAFLEDSGYMARAAFVMDRVMSAAGLQGRSFLPMLVGFGCTVPAIYATRTLKNPRDRTLTALLVPFMSCSARLPVYVLIATVFFSRHAGAVVFAIYLLGIVVAIAVGMILRRSLLRGGRTTPAIMEMPPYRMPTLRSLGFHTWNRTRSFLRDASTIILTTSVVVWLLMATPVGGSGTFADTEIDESAFGLVAEAVSPVLQPLGFGSWEATGSLMSGFVAKEVVISTLAQTNAVGPDTADAAGSPLDDIRELVTGTVAAAVDTVKAVPKIVGIDLSSDAAEDPPTGLMAAIRDDFEETSGGHAATAGLAFMVFVLLYTPCMAAVAAERRELGPRWMWRSIIGQTVLAWVMALVVFQGGVFLAGLI